MTFDNTKTNSVGKKKTTAQPFLLHRNGFKKPEVNDKIIPNQKLAYFMYVYVLQSVCF